MDEFISKKHDMLTRVRDMTKNCVFVGDENDGVRYINLYAERDEIFTEIYALDEETGGVTSDGIKNLINEIVELDKAILPYAKKAKEAIQNNIKGINVGKTLNMGYNRIAIGNEGMRFDSSN